jgi:hypothetical protein
MVNAEREDFEHLDQLQHCRKPLFQSLKSIFFQTELVSSPDDDDSLPTETTNRLISRQVYQIREVGGVTPNLSTQFASKLFSVWKHVTFYA